MTPKVNDSGADMASDRFQPYKVSAAYHAHLALNAKWTECDGWRMPEAFGNPEEEAGRVRRAVGLQDVSDIGKLDARGTSLDGPLSECEWLDGVRAVLRLKPGHALILTAPGHERQVRHSVAGLFDKSGGCAHLTEMTSGLTALALVGPRAAGVLARLTALDLRSEKFHDKACAQCDLAHVHATIYRSDWGDLRSYVLLVGRDVGEYLWTTIQHAGEKLGLTPFGVAAERWLRDAQMAGRPRAQVVSAKPPVVSPS
jgi:sarcosine oxidase subunit alpha